MLAMSMTGQEKVNAVLAIAFAPQAARSLSRAANASKTAMVRAIADALGARQSDIKRYVWTQPASLNRLQARVYPLGKRGIPLIKLGATGPDPSRGKGNVSVQLALSSKRYLFIATMPTTGHRGVFQRVGRKRLPIQEIRTVPIPVLFRQFRAVGVARAAEALKSNLAADMTFALRKRA